MIASASRSGAERSQSRRLLRAAVGLAGEGVRLDLWRDLRLVPPFSEDDESEPAWPVQVLRLAIADADAALFATPEYNGSIPGPAQERGRWGVAALW